MKLWSTREHIEEEKNTKRYIKVKEKYKNKERN